MAPYLRLRQRVRVGPWEVVPADGLTLEDCLSQHALDQARGLIELYRRPAGVHEGFGCFLRRGVARIGESYGNRDLTSFRRALLLGALDVNVTPWRGSVDDYNWGWRTATSDSLFFAWHRVDPGGWVSTRTGAIITTLHGGLRIGEGDEVEGMPPSQFAPLLELPFPFMAREPDLEYAEALFDILESDDARAQRLAAAIDWLDLACRNTTSISEGTRILLLKAGFEALLAAGYNLPTQRALAALLGREAGRRRWRTPIDRYGNALPREQMTDVEWWYSRFTWLRNAIAHGGREVKPRDWKHGRASHFWLGAHWLRSALRAEVADAAGRPYLRETDPFARIAQRFVWEQNQAV